MKNAKKIVTLLLAVMMLCSTSSLMAAENEVISTWTGGSPVIIEDDVPYEGYEGGVIEKCETNSSVPLSYSPMISVEDGCTYFYSGWFKGNPEFVISLYGIKDGVDGSYLDQIKNSPGNQENWFSYAYSFVASSTKGEVTGIQVAVRNKRTTVTCRFSDITVEKKMTADITNWTLSSYTTKNDADKTITHNFNNDSGKYVEMAKTAVVLVPGKAYKLTLEHTASDFDSKNGGKYLYPMVRTYFYNTDYSIGHQTDYKVSGTVNYAETYKSEGISGAKYNSYSYQTLQYPTASEPWAKSTVYFVAPNTAYTNALIYLMQPTSSKIDGTTTIRNVVLTEDVSEITVSSNGTKLNANEIVSDGAINVNYHYVSKKLLATDENPDVNFVAAVYKVDGDKKSLCSVNILKDKALRVIDAAPKFDVAVPQDASLTLDVPALESGKYEIKVMAWDDLSLLNAKSKTFVHEATFTAQ